MHADARRQPWVTTRERLPEVVVLPLCPLTMPLLPVMVLPRPVVMAVCTAVLVVAWLLAVTTACDVLETLPRPVVIVVCGAADAAVVAVV